ncbi:hypothetical protein, partial [Actinobacillus pleuropneumoniae]|uniref:hypothetical protein n=1 Tax=Actinobacillus pleuropneumoniae TaxID=715 RepID=UPI002EAF7A33|nr:hypothetical protein [Actinobacillus pleuropneumoniae]
AAVIKAVVVLVQKETYNQWNRIQNPEINLDTCGQLIFEKGGKNIKWKKQCHQQVVAGKLDICM